MKVSNKPVAKMLPTNQVSKPVAVKQPQKVVTATRTVKPALVKMLPKNVVRNATTSPAQQKAQTKGSFAVKAAPIVRNATTPPAKQNLPFKEAPKGTAAKPVAKQAPLSMPQRPAQSVIKQGVVQKGAVPMMQKVVGAKMQPQSATPKTVARNVAPSVSKIVGEKSKADFKLPANRPAGKVVKQDGEIFVHGDDGFLYQYVEDKQMGEIGGFFKKIRKLAGKALKVVAPVARFIPPLAPYALAISAAGFAQSALSRRRKGGAAPVATASPATPVTQPVQATAAPTIAPSTSASGDSGGGVSVPSSAFTSDQKTTDQNLPTTGVSKNVVLVGFGLAALYLLTRKTRT